MLLPIICWLMAALFIIMGFISSRSKKPAGIYSNIKAPDKENIADLKAYNKAVGRLLIGYGMLQAAMGLFLAIINISERKAGTLLAGSFFFGAILMMIVYETVISEKYIKKKQE